MFPPLDPGASSTLTTDITVPAGLFPGIYYVIAVADSTNASAEYFETNNQRSVFINIR
jgi:subtilase family serine protease